MAHLRPDQRQGRVVNKEADLGLLSGIDNTIYKHLGEAGTYYRSNGTPQALLHTSRTSTEIHKLPSIYKVAIKERQCCPGTILM